MGRNKGGCWRDHMCAWQVRPHMHGQQRLGNHGEVVEVQMAVMTTRICGQH